MVSSLAPPPLKASTAQPHLDRRSMESSLSPPPLKASIVPPALMGDP